jgi:hypothetical protein
VALLDGQPPHSWTTTALEEACVLTARRMARLYGIDRPGILRRDPVQTVHRRPHRSAASWFRTEAGRLDTHRELRAVMINARRVLDPAFCDGVRAARQLPALSAPD